jgi:hypothetical protein
MTRTLTRLATLLVAGTAAFAVPAMAQQPAPAAPPAVSPTVNIAESHMRVARDVVEASGMARSFDAVLPELSLRLRQNFAASRPEIIKDMDDTLVALAPEIRARRSEMIDFAARALASRMTEPELRDTSTFFNSASGKKYVNSQPALLDDVLRGMDEWMQRTSEVLMSRFREEMRRKGHTV